MARAITGRLRRRSREDLRQGTHHGGHRAEPAGRGPPVAAGFAGTRQPPGRGPAHRVSGHHDAQQDGVRRDRPPAIRPAIRGTCDHRRELR
ncbi:hypothetical protein ADK67_15645 [Saccharothrix sp. NRRL B-16348]|nr:hypothetical protein ADK67_15645 [Saccharothrix sp. NRRL B-16348]